MGVALLMAGCSAENGSEEGVGTPIRLGYTVVTAEATRAATNLNEGHLKADDKVMVQVSTHDADSYSPYAFLVVDDAGQMVPASAPIPTYPDNGDHVDIVAYYPSTAETSFTVKADQTSDDNYRASDLMVASISNQERTTSAVDLRFEHQMAKIIVNATAADPSIAINGITLKNIAPTVTFSQTAAVDYSTAATGSIDITMSNNGAALIPQQTVNGQFLVISTSAGNATYSLTKDFTASHQYTLNIEVSAAAVGANIRITGWSSDGSVTVVTAPLPDMTPAGVVAVDLGLSVKWANMNVGATTVTGYGTYFAWGETFGYTNESNYDKNIFTWDNYSYCNGSMTTLTKYCTDSSKGVVDNKTKLDFCDDAAYVNWGGSWRMPSRAEIKELLDNTTKVWQTNYNSTGVTGFLLTSTVSGYESKSIFLPSTGYVSGSGSKHEEGRYGNYLSSSLSSTSECLYAIYFIKNEIGTVAPTISNNGQRNIGYPVRAVQ